MYYSLLLLLPTKSNQKRYEQIGINLDWHVSALIDSGTRALGIGMRISNLTLFKVAVVEAELKRQIRPSVTE